MPTFDEREGATIVIPTPAIMLKDYGRIISIIVTKEEARNMKSVLEGQQEQPGACEVIASLVRSTGTEMKGTFIYGVQDYHYLSKLCFKRPDRVDVEEVNCKPSDAILISVLTDSPIYVRSDLMDEFSVGISEIPRGHFQSTKPSD